MRSLDAELLDACLGCGVERGDRWAPWLDEAARLFSIDTPHRLAAFLGQVGHESGKLSIVEENLRYGKAGLLTVFKKYFTEAEADVYQKQPELIANRVYGGRMGNGPESSGDGWRFRGRGLIQLTGRDNYIACGRALGIDLLNEPDLLLEPKWASCSAGWFWQGRGLNAQADTWDLPAITKKINGGNIGLAERVLLSNRALAALEG